MLKLDIEGGEWYFLNSLNNNELQKFKQITMEFHFPHHINKITEQKKKERSDKKKEYIINYDRVLSFAESKIES